MIETEHLVLRAHRIEDFAAYIPLWTQRLSGEDGKFRFPPLRDEEVWARLLRWIGHRHVFGFAPFLVFDRSTDRLCGEVGFGHFHRGNGPAFDGTPEGMWTLHPDFHGKGLAGEAAAAALAWFDSSQASRRTVCMIGADNRASLRLAARLGYMEFIEVMHKGEAMKLFERIRPEQ